MKLWKGESCTKTHYIRVGFLEQVVLYEVDRLACFANEYEYDFIKAMVGQSAKVTENDRARERRELDGLLARDEEPDVVLDNKNAECPLWETQIP